MKGRVSLAEGQAVDLRAGRRKRELSELDRRELAKTSGGKGVFELHFRVAVFTGRELKPLLDRGIRGRFGPLRNIGPLYGDGPFDKA